MFTSKLWDRVGLNNGAKGDVVYFLYKYEAVTRIGNLHEDFVVKCGKLYGNFEPFLSEIPWTVTMLVVQAEWQKPSGYNFW